MYSKQIRRSADITVRRICGIKQGEKILIVTNRGPDARDVEKIAHALYDAALGAGAEPVIAVQGVKQSLDNADPAVIAALGTEPDVLFSISANKLGRDPLMAAAPAEYEGVAYDHIFDYLLAKKQMRAVWTPGITADIFERTVDIDYEELAGRCRALCRLYEDTVSVHVCAPGGTDIVVPVAGRRPFSDNGIFRRGGQGGNIPAGEVFISPVVGTGPETGCRGQIVFDGSISAADGDLRIDTPITVDVCDGFVSEIRGGSEADILFDTICRAEYAALEKEKDGRLPSGQGAVYARNARNIGELGIGLNPAAAVAGNMLEDEKAFKTCHFAVGANYDGDAPALIHLDGVVRNPTITFQKRDGSAVPALKDGLLQF